MSKELSAKPVILSTFALSTADEDFPAEARRRSVDAIIDVIGCAIGGSLETVSKSVLKVIDTHSSGAKPLLGTSLFTSATDSALYNGTAAHALDFDDSAHPAYAHPSAVVVPAIMAVFDHETMTGRDVVSAHIVGVEVFNKLGHALNKDHARFGWHPTGTFGSLAAAAAVGRLMRLSPREFNMAISIAASSTSGLRANFGTQTKPIHAGFAARNGVLAALLAQAGIDAIEDTFSHPMGFPQTFNRNGKVDLAAFESWGEPLEIMTDVGLALKPFPSCAAAHPATEAGLILREKLQNNLDLIQSITIAIPDFAFESLIKKMPTTPGQARFSVEYGVAIAMLDGVVGLASFTADRMSDPAVSALMHKMQIVSDERVREDHEFAAVITVTTRDGNRLEQLVPLAMGKPERWFTKEALFQKYSGCASAVIGDECAKKTFQHLQSLDSLVGGVAIFSNLGPGS